jgi:hypothetical protein
MAQEVFLAAGDPKRFPEQLREGLRPWSPLKVYGHVPFFEPTKDKTIYDYATDKYLPIRFENYVDKTFITEKPSTTLEVAEGKFDAAAGLTYLQIGRTGWGFQKSQNGGGTTPPPGTYLPITAMVRWLTSGIKNLRSTTASIFRCRELPR